MGKEIRERFADFILNTNYEGLPKEVIHQAKRCLLDFLGVALGGSNVGCAPLITDIICNLGGRKEATIVGDGRKIPALNAALVNGFKGHTLDMDDGHRYASGHPAVVVIPAAIAITEKGNLTGKELIEGIIVGYETFIRIASFINPSHLKKGFHTTGTVGPFGAAAACSKILRLNKNGIKNALSIAGLQGSGLLEVMDTGEVMKPLHPGRAAQAGLLSALLAKEGAEGPDLIFEGEKGFLKAFSEASEFNKITNDLGIKFEIMNVYFKLHAACRHVHPTLDAVLEILNRNKINIDAINEIEVFTYPIAFKMTGQSKEINNELAAKFNIPYSVALAMVYGKTGIDEYSPENIENPIVQELAKKVRVSVDKEREKDYPNKRGSRVRIKTVKGTYTHEVDLAKGEPELPFSDDELRDKLLQNAKKILKIEKIGEIQKHLFNIEEEPISEFVKYLF